MSFETTQSPTCRIPTSDSIVTSEALERIILDQNNQATKSRKRVRFDADDQNTRRMKVRVAGSVSRSTNMVHEDEYSTWYQKSHLRENLQQSKLIATTFALQSSVDHEVKTYSETLASTYASCAVDSDEGLEVSEYFAQHLALVSNIEHTSVNGESARGLEKIAVPSVGREALRRRNEVICNVLLAQQALNLHTSFNDRHEMIRLISEEQSRCARNFAKSLGTSDAVSALMEYGSSSINTVAVEESHNLPTKAEDTLYKPSMSLLSICNSQNSMAV